MSDIYRNKAFVGVIGVIVLVIFWYLLTIYIKSCVRDEILSMQKKMLKKRKQLEQQQQQQQQQNDNESYVDPLA